jgi:predicted nucleic acid-binding protein
MTTVLEAIELHERYKYSFWDSLIIAAAASEGATTILSEDIADGQTIKDITIKNPFK